MTSPRTPSAIPDDAFEHQGEAWLRLITDAVPALISYVDKDRRYRYTNRAYTEWFGRTAAEIYGKSIVDVVGEDAYAAAKPSIDAVLSGQAVTLEATLNYRGRGPRHVRIDLIPNVGDGGAVEGYFALINDLSERHEKDQQIAALNSELRGRLEEFEALLRVLPVGIFVAHDPSCAHITMNPAGAAMLRLPVTANSSLSGTPGGSLGFRVLRNGVELTGDELPMQRAAREGIPVTREEVDVVFDDGQVTTLYEYALPLFDDLRRVRGALGVFVDITERKRHEAALSEADRRKDEFLAMLAHELRNPLAPIRTAAEILKIVDSPDPNHRWAREVIERQTQHLARLVDDLLDVSRITRGKVTLRRERVSLETVVHRAVETNRPLLDERRHQLTISLPAPPVLVEGDPTRLVQVVGNLVNNAAKYTDEGGRIAVSVARDGAAAVIRVRDSGIGIAPELLPSMFDVFTQSSQALDRSQGGLGIGLTLARQLVELHGGSVEGRSDGPGQGSEFIIRLPALPEQVEANAMPVGDGRAAGAARALRVVVVEDHVDSAEMMAFVLRLGGHQVEIAASGTAALEVVPRFGPHVVLCDIGLPGMDGYELAARLGDWSRASGATLIALTGYGRDEDRRRAAAAGFKHHLAKPVEPRALEDLLAALGADPA